MEKISNVLCRWPWNDEHPFYELLLFVRGVKEILLCDAIMPSDLQLDNLKESTKRFDWQGKDKALFDVFLSHKERYDSLVDDRNKRLKEENEKYEIAMRDEGHGNCNSYRLPREKYFRPEKIIRVEINFKPDLPEGSKVITSIESPSTALGDNP